MYNPLAMTPAGWITIAIIAVAALLLVTERLRPDLVALLVLLALALSGVVTPEEAVSGFSRSAVVTILALFILTRGLEKTGVTRWVSLRLLALAGPSLPRLTAILMLTSAGLSVFMNTIAAAAVLLPITMSIARHSGHPPSRLLMPLAFGVLLGGTSTLLTTANIIVSASLAAHSVQPFGLFDFAPIGLPVALLGVLLGVALSPRLLPSRDVAGEVARMSRLRTELAQVYHLHEGTCEVAIEPGSRLAGETLDQAGWGHDLGLTVLAISHHGRLRLAPDRDARIQEGDVVLLEGAPTPEQMESYGLRFTSAPGLEQALLSHSVPMAEVTLAPRSALEGRTLRDIRFRDRHGLQVLAIWRQGLVIQHELGEIPLRFGDAMLVQGARDRLDLLRFAEDFLLLEEAGNGRPGRKGALAAGIMIACLALAAAGALPIAVATLGGAALMVVTGCLTMDDAYRAVEWRTVFLVAGMLPLGIALDRTGTSMRLGQSLVQAGGGFGALGTAAVLLLTTVALSTLLGGQTVAVILAPVAIAAARAIGADPRGMAMAVALGCSLGFLSPLTHPASMLVMGPGGYTTRDYFRLGAPLTALSILVTLAGLHWIWGL